jgi:hypothetical protein
MYCTVYFPNLHGSEFPLVCCLYHMSSVLWIRIRDNQKVFTESESVSEKKVLVRIRIVPWRNVNGRNVLGHSVPGCNVPATELAFRQSVPRTEYPLGTESTSQIFWTKRAKCPRNLRDVLSSLTKHCPLFKHVIFLTIIIDLKSVPNFFHKTDQTSPNFFKKSYSHNEVVGAARAASFFRPRFQSRIRTMRLHNIV